MTQPLIKTTARLILHEEKVLRRIDGQRRRILFRTAGYTRTTVARSMRPATRRQKIGRVAAKKGTPPLARTKRLRDGVQFAVDTAAGSFVVGVTPNHSQTTEPRGGKTVPQLLNEGGLAVITDFEGRQYKAQFDPHPFTDYPPTLAKAEAALARNIETIGLT